MSSSGRVFLREATGLVRSLTAFDAYALGIVGITPGVTIVLWYVYITFLYPGADMVWTAIGSLPIGLVYAGGYYLMSISMPRSGGEYVWGSRIIHPLWGFLPNWMYMYAQVFCLGYLAATIGGGYLAPYLSILASFYNNPSLGNWASTVSSPNGAFALSLAVIWVSLLINIRGIRAYAAATAIMFVIAMAGVVLTFVLLATTNNQAFQAAFNHYAASYNTSYQGIIDLAESNGWKPQPPAFDQTSFALVYMAGTSLATAWPVLAAGEIRAPQKSMFWGTVGAVLTSGVIFVLGAVLFYNTVGDTFAKAFSFVAFSGSVTNPLPAAPYIQYLTSMVTQNSAIIFFLGFSYVVWIIIIMPAYYVIISRSMFAWSFDRLLPSLFANISDRLHAPINALCITALIGTFAAYLTVYTTILGFVFNITLAVVSSFVFVGIAAAVFPYSKKARKIYESAPAIVRTNIGGLPLITVLGVIIAAVFAWMTYLGLISPALSGPVNPASVTLWIGVYVTAIVLYFVAKAYHKRHGLDIDLAFQEIPPE
jgi:amino acid transporter